MQIKFTRAALLSLDAALTYIAAQEDEQTAQALYAHIRKQINSLLAHPYRGRPGRVSGTRELDTVYTSSC